MAVRAAAAKVPAARPLAGRFAMNLDRFLQVRALQRFVNMLVIDPAIAVAGHLPVRRPHCIDGMRIARECHRDAENSDWQATPGEYPVQAPEAGARAVLVNRLHVHVAHAGDCRRPDDLGQKRFRRGIAVQDAVLRSFLVIHDKLQSETRAARPLRVRRCVGVAAQVARIGVVSHVAPCCPGTRRRQARALRQSLPSGYRSA